jgi:hypothetical protein
LSFHARKIVSRINFSGASKEELLEGFGSTRTLVADRAHALLSDDLTIDTNRAHALIFVGRGEESKALYLAHKGKPVSGQVAKPGE